MPNPSEGIPSGGTDLLEQVHEEVRPDQPWNTLLWNDPVNLASVVSMILVKVLEVTPEVAESLMLTAHLEGKAAVKSGSREECEQVANALMAHSLWATIEKAGS